MCGSENKQVAKYTSIGPDYAEGRDRLEQETTAGVLFSTIIQLSDSAARGKHESVAQYFGVSTPENVLASRTSGYLITWGKERVSLKGFKAFNDLSVVNTKFWKCGCVSVDNYHLSP